MSILYRINHFDILDLLYPLVHEKFKLKVREYTYKQFYKDDLQIIIHLFIILLCVEIVSSET